MEREREEGRERWKMKEMERKIGNGEKPGRKERGKWSEK